MGEIRLLAVESSNIDLKELIDRLDADLQQRYPVENGNYNLRRSVSISNMAMKKSSLSENMSTIHIVCAMRRCLSKSMKSKKAQRVLGLLLVAMQSILIIVGGQM
ncbi:hypothetical protein BVG16_13355 [Paenibacillus selenitireducens]|uniref:Uncharacterized protein n=1 Tax=Paenibacillus selenitireducens TaxID=1324314 RepID=A0A1T2XC71_9BACL|nr:hypothetical protein BVG16_13355 [Paenibacillus selenitireducens]